MSITIRHVVGFACLAVFCGEPTSVVPVCANDPH